MITPLDLENKKFEHAAFGYKRSDVDDFMSCIVPEYEALYKQSLENSDKMKSLEEKIESYKAMEDTMKNTLIMAQNTADEVQKNARKEADLIIEKAKADAQKIIDDAKQQASGIASESEQAKNEMDMFINRSVGLLNAQIESLKNFGK